MNFIGFLGSIECNLEGMLFYLSIIEVPGVARVIPSYSRRLPALSLKL